MAKPALKQNAAQTPVTPENTTTTTTNTDGSDSKTFEALKKEFEQNRNIVLRKVNFVYARKLLENPKMTWADYCDMKKEVFSEHWEAKKTNPAANKILRALSPERVQKKLNARAKLMAKLAEYDKQLELSGAKA